MTSTVAPAVGYDAWFDSRWGRYAWRIETRAVLAALGPLPGRRIADVGCGTGRLLGILTGGRSHGYARISGALFAAAHLPALPLLGPVLETAGKLTPRFGAFQILAVRTGTPGPGRLIFAP